MSSSDLNSVEDRWVAAKNRIFAGQLNDDNIVEIVDFECPSVFRAPKDLAETKPEAYTPQLLGLGPFHHQRRDLYTMQRKKLTSVVQFLGPDHIKKLEAAVHTLEEYQIRASYHDQLDHSPQALAWIIAIDSVYLLLWLSRREEYHNMNMDIDGQQVDADVLMLENQIPATFVIWTLMKLGLETPRELSNLQELSNLVFDFCREASPLGLKKIQIEEAVLKRKGHVLSMMYHSILGLNEVTLNESQSSTARKPSAIRKSSTVSPPPTDLDQIRISSTVSPPPTGLDQIIGISSTVSPPPTGLDQISKSSTVSPPSTGPDPIEAITAFNRVWGMLTGLFKRMDPDYEADGGAEEIRIPSVYQLERNAGFKFAPLQGGGGIKEIRLEGKKLLLPNLTLQSNSEVILRNLCAYEAVVNKSRLMGEYIDLMCGIVDTAQDVEKLIDAGVITNHLEPKEIAAIFSGKMWKVRPDNKEAAKSNIGLTIVAINRVYGQSRKVRTLRFIGKVVGKLRILIIFILILIVVCSLLLSVVCEIHDCHQKL